MKLQDLFDAIVNPNKIMVNLYDENDLLLITFGLSGYDALDDYLLERKVSEVEILTLASIRVKLAAEDRGSFDQDGNEEL